MSEQTVLVALFPYATQAEFAILCLKRLGFELKNISVCGRTCANEMEDHIGVCVSAGKFTAGSGPVGFWERMCDTLSDGGFFDVPRIGRIAIAGGFVNDFMAAVDEHSPTDTLTALGRAICRLGIAKDNVLRFEVEIQANECALLALGTREQLVRAKNALYSLGVSDFVTGTDVRERFARQALQKVS